MALCSVSLLCFPIIVILSSTPGLTLKEETFAEETFAISRFLAKFAKVCSREIFVNYKSRKFILAGKKEF